MTPEEAIVVALKDYAVVYQNYACCLSGVVASWQRGIVSAVYQTPGGYPVHTLADLCEYPGFDYNRRVKNLRDERVAAVDMEAFITSVCVCVNVWVERVGPLHDLTIDGRDRLLCRIEACRYIASLNSGLSMGTIQSAMADVEADEARIDNNNYAGYIAAAREEYAGGDDIEIDETPRVSVSDEGAFVHAWVWVDKKPSNED